MRRNALPTIQWPQIITISLSTCCGLGLGRAPLLDVVRARLTPQLGVWPGWKHPGRLCSQELSAGAPSSPQQDGPNCFTRQVRGLNRGCQAPKLWARSHAASLLLCSVQSKYKDAGAASLPDGRTDKVTCTRAVGSEGMSEANCGNNLNSIIPFLQEVEGTEWASDSPEVTQSQDWKPHNLTCL